MILICERVYKSGNSAGWTRSTWTGPKSTCRLANTGWLTLEKKPDIVAPSWDSLSILEPAPRLSAARRSSRILLTSAPTPNAAAIRHPNVVCNLVRVGLAHSRHAVSHEDQVLWTGTRLKHLHRGQQRV